MTLEQLIAEWKTDAKLDITNLAVESLKDHVLHGKYYAFYMQAKSRCNLLEDQLAKLTLEKREFFQLGDNEETRAKGWKLPPKGRLFVREDLNVYLSADQDLIDLKLKLNHAYEKRDFLKSILQSISQRSFLIKNAIEFMKMHHGDK